MERRESKSRSQAGLKRYEIVIKNKSFWWFPNRKECGYTYAMKLNGLYTNERGNKMTTATTTEISVLTAKSILTKAGIGNFYVGVNEYRGYGFQFRNNSFQWTSSTQHNRQLEITLKLISYLNTAGISYEIADVQGRWSDSICKQAIVLTNGGK
jgi:hypothetical protein